MFSIVMEGDLLVMTRYFTAEYFYFYFFLLK